jgi:hypothetical protein
LNTSPGELADIEIFSFECDVVEAKAHCLSIVFDLSLFPNSNFQDLTLELTLEPMAKRRWTDSEEPEAEDL